MVRKKAKQKQILSSNLTQDKVQSFTQHNLTSSPVMQHKLIQISPKDNCTCMSRQSDRFGGVEGVFYSNSLYHLATLGPGHVLAINI